MNRNANGENSQQKTPSGYRRELGRSAGVQAMGVVAAACLLMLPAAAHSEMNATYTYDALGRLVSVVYTDGSKTTTVTYNYDASGNRSSVVVK